MTENRTDKAYTYEEVAVILGVSRGTVERHYRGPSFKVGSETRIWSAHLNCWINEIAGVKGYRTGERDENDESDWNPKVSD